MTFSDNKTFLMIRNLEKMRFHKHITIQSTSVFTFILCGCSKSVTMADLHGNYTANYPVAVENLTLMPNGKFTQKVVIKSTKKMTTASGNWMYDSYNDCVNCDENFLTVVDGFGALRKIYKTNHFRVLLPIKTVPTQPLSLGASEDPVKYEKNSP